ncbi:unnamed protein product [Tilletia controversa]|uniref:Bicarbonate transporter-like transmembrane domain-containing protein n=3 Tax=Tilletia TaxID=13289 RepID=A0A8X7SX75_9BASI|nr:hypothetical protein CF336_g4087 [Tilletia laevis]KAE8197709.1 hypothetical protein CF328_g3769 [Tilletia controversa]KAE8261228.1 hypothetical protein A4X03_0g3434 [Tilletia caries]KAE8202882.1 hypothetical protein CF335_g3244 [Tilletia laevis]KAE8248512.1 hypothetical protein A4X06_0g3658 [Tilletia controversa]
MASQGSSSALASDAVPTTSTATPLDDSATMTSTTRHPYHNNDISEQPYGDFNRAGLVEQGISQDGGSGGDDLKGGGGNTGSNSDDMEPKFPHFKDDLPWSQRSWAYELKPFRGMYYDIRRRLPFYWTDWTLAFTRPDNYWTQVISVIQMYFLNLMPAIAYVLDMDHRTNGSYGINEVILASALAAIVFPIFSVQPLTIVGVTGLINLQNYTVYNIFVGYYGFDNMKYLRIQAWSLIWGAAFHFIAAIFNVCDFTRFITDMTTQTFGFYVGIVYIQKGIELLILEYIPTEESPDLDNATGWLSVTIAILFTVSVYLVTAIGKTRFLTLSVRRLFSAFAMAAGLLFWTGFSHFPDYSLRRIPVERLPITKSWFPTMDRSWFIDFWNIELKWVFVAAPLGFVLFVLFYFDHSVSSIGAQARQFPVKRPAGFHWDFFLLGITTLVSGFLGLPAPNGLVPQAPVHTESLTVFRQVDVDEDDDEGDALQDGRRHYDDDGASDATRPGNGAEKVKPVHRRKSSKRQHVITDRVAEQRLTHLVIGLLTLGTMTRPLLVCLGLMPRAVFAGVFILVGWDSVETNSITKRTLALFRDRRLDSYVPLPSPGEEREGERAGTLGEDVVPSEQSDPLLSVSKKKIALFVGIQWLFFALTIAISQTIAAIGFPIVITPLIAVRYYLVPRWFTPLELRILDAPTAEADVVLASLGHESEQVTGQGIRVARDCAGMAGTEYGRTKTE